MKSVIFIAPPAAGKGTQSTLLCEKYNLNHISTGDLLREEVISGNKELDEIMLSGKLVSDEIILNLLTKKLDNITTGYVLDGFPRNVSQAETFDKILNNLNLRLDFVIYLYLDKEEAKKRIVGRISCPTCGRVYNDQIDDLKPTAEGLCDDCQSTLVKRADDNSETFEKRYETYLKETEPLIRYYKSKGNLLQIDASLTKEEIFGQIESIIND